MNNVHLKKTLQLIRRTGDKGIIIDEESDELFVLMDVKSYEKMLDKNDGNDQSEQFDHLIETEEESHPIAPAPMSPIKAPASNELNFHEDWTPKQNNVMMEESLADVPHDGEEEEKFYLEPVV